MDRPEVGIGRQKIESGGHFSTAARNGGWIFCLHLWPKSINRRGPAGLHVRSQTIQFNLGKNEKKHIIFINNSQNCLFLSETIGLKELFIAHSCATFCDFSYVFWLLKNFEKNID